MSTPPENLVLRILEQKRFSSAATEWGVQQEPVAIREYMVFQQAHGHEHLVVASCGFLVSEKHPYLGATPDGAVFYPSHLHEPFGFLEVKCPYSRRNDTPADACSAPGFCCTLDKESDRTQQLRLRRRHLYFAQVQGQMAMGERQWCDFVIYTTK